MWIVPDSSNRVRSTKEETGCAASRWNTTSIDLDHFPFDAIGIEVDAGDWNLAIMEHPANTCSLAN
jgi:hypothetical protein